jgi:hypothetical protein
MSPLLYQLSYRAAAPGDASTRAGCVAAGGAAEVRCGRSMLILSSQALGQTLALIATFIGIGILVNLLIAYVIAQVLGEHKRNQEGEPPAS